MMKELENKELTRVNGGHDVEYWVNTINKYYSLYDAERLAVVYESLSNLLQTDDDISAPLKERLRELMKMLLETKQRVAA